MNFDFLLIGYAIPLLLLGFMASPLAVGGKIVISPRAIPLEAFTNYPQRSHMNPDNATNTENLGNGYFVPVDPMDLLQCESCQ